MITRPILTQPSIAYAWHERPSGRARCLVEVKANRLHDGSASTPEQAILMHGAEAGGVTQRYQQLPAEQKRELLEFLKSL